MRASGKKYISIKIKIVNLPTEICTNLAVGMSRGKDMVSRCKATS